MSNFRQMAAKHVIGVNTSQTIKKNHIHANSQIPQTHSNTG